VVATDKFANLALQSAEQFGLCEARIVSVSHPVGGVGREDLHRRADEALEDIMERLLGR
jgi:hypothetical protein